MINQSALKLLIDTLNSNNIIWGVGGSFLLQIYELYAEPNDLDLWVQPSDMPLIRDVFRGYDEIETDIPLPKEFHFKMLYFNIEVDFVACFITKPNQNRFEYQIMPSNIRMLQLSGKLTIPCTFLEDWYIIYRLLKRDEKADLIGSFFIKKKMDIDIVALEYAAKSNRNHLPQYLKKDIPKLVYDATQYSLSDYNLI